MLRIIMALMFVLTLGCNKTEEERWERHKEHYEVQEDRRLDVAELYGDFLSKTDQFITECQHFLYLEYPSLCTIQEVDDDFNSVGCRYLITVSLDKIKRLEVRCP